MKTNPTNGNGGHITSYNEEGGQGITPVKKVGEISQVNNGENPNAAFENAMRVSETTAEVPNLLVSTEPTPFDRLVQRYVPERMTDEKFREGVFKIVQVEQSMTGQQIRDAAENLSGFMRDLTLSCFKRQQEISNQPNGKSGVPSR